MAVMTRARCIAVCGPRQASPAALELAEAVGAALAEAGCDLVCGGREGVMEAAARGLRRQRGTAARPLVIGILPGERAEEANPYCDVVLPSGLGVARNALVVRAADAVILLGGGSGTLSEAALAWQLGKPLVALVGADGWAQRLAGAAIDDRRRDVIFPAQDAPAAVRLVLAALEERGADDDDGG